MPPRARARRYDPARTRAAVSAQARNLREAVGGPGEGPVDASARALIEAAGDELPEDALVARCAELVLLTDDLTTATGLAIPYDRQALATATRWLADALAAKAPGGSVELRIPPFAVVQCVAGPRHTRGTPPNVVETDPLTWVRLATGRIGWTEALEAGDVTASGERADLAAHLPVAAGSGGDTAPRQV